MPSSTSSSSVLERPPITAVEPSFIVNSVEMLFIFTMGNLP